MFLGDDIAKLINILNFPLFTRAIQKSQSDPVKDKVMSEKLTLNTYIVFNNNIHQTAIYFPCVYFYRRRPKKFSKYTQNINHLHYILAYFNKTCRLRLKVFGKFVKILFFSYCFRNFHFTKNVIEQSMQQSAPCFKWYSIIFSKSSLVFGESTNQT